MINKAPVYNLKTVLQETGLKADVLRVWERRYGLPRPQRSQGGHRLYSDFDIAVIKWLRARQAEGISISRAVELWKELSESGSDPLAEDQPVTTPASEEHAGTDTHIDMMRNQWLDACMQFDGRKAEEILNQAFALYPVETVCMQVIQQGVRAIGDLWYTGIASVQQEHFTSALAVRRLEALILAAPNPTRAVTVLVACPAGETHIFPALLLTLLLRRRGLKVVYLGGDVPMEEMHETLPVIRPNIIVLAAQHVVSAAALSAWAAALREQKIPVAYGGLIFNRVPALRKRIAAWFLGDSIESAVEQIERLALRQDAYPRAVSINDDARAAAQSYREKRPLIELDLANRLGAYPLPAESIGEINNYFGSGLTAALELGDPAFLEPDLKWITRLLARRRIPAGLLSTYLRLYGESVRSVMGADGNIIAGWLEDQNPSR